MGVAVLAAGFLMNNSSQAADKKGDFGDARFQALVGKQSAWPKAKNARMITDRAVPIYLGLPATAYTVLGRVHDPRTRGIGVVGKVIAEGIFAETERQRDCARLAKARGGNALLVSEHEVFRKAFNLTSEQVRKTAPLFNHKDSIVLVVKLKKSAKKSDAETK